jgi:hypothetical protein
VDAVDNGGSLIEPFIGGQVEGASIGGISMVPITGDGNGVGETMGCSHF